MLSDRAAHLEPIKAAPDDDAPRLVYADWLDEHGEGERAEFVRVSIRAAEYERQLGPRLRPDPDSPPAVIGRATGPDETAIVRRMRGLLATNFKRWLPTALVAAWPRASQMGFGGFVIKDPSRSYTESVEFDRGFVRAAALPAADWLAHADALTAEHPIREVWLTTPPDVEVSFGPFEPRSERGETRPMCIANLRGIDKPAHVPHDAGLAAERLLKHVWPGIKFHLPIDPEELPPSMDLLNEMAGQLIGVNAAAIFDPPA